jgi:hypothetical protein
VKTITTILILSLFSGCPLEPTAPGQLTVVKIGEPFDLKIEGTALIENEEILFRFADVAEDSRCPIGMMCIWAGNAKVVINISDVSDTINTNNNPSAILYNQYLITLDNLTPYPRVDVPRIKSEYVGRFIVTKIRYIQ